MHYWWVNQNQTHQHEIAGGYLWSPKRKQNGHRNAFYEFMRAVAPGDIVFSFVDTYIKAVGVIRSYCYEAPKPMAFGSVGANWEQIGWRVDVRFRSLDRPIRPKDHMGRLGPHLPSKYAPLQPSGDGLQSVYLTQLPAGFTDELVAVMGNEAYAVLSELKRMDPQSSFAALGLTQWEEHEIEVVKASAEIPETTREAIVQARRGQGIFKQNVMKIERHCRITGVNRVEHLRASHCMPWRDASNTERLDGNNGLLLTPTADHLFDRGFITFDSRGRVLISSVADRDSLRKMGLDADALPTPRPLSSEQERYMQFHRENVFLQANLA